MRCGVSAWVSMTMAEAWTAAGLAAVLWVTGFGVFWEYAMRASGVAAKKTSAERRLFMMLAGRIVTRIVAIRGTHMLGAVWQARLFALLLPEVPVGDGGDGGDHFRAFFPRAHQVIAVHRRDHFERNFLGANAGAFADVGAAAKAFGVHLADHADGAVILLRLALGQDAEVRDFRSGEERG